MKINLHKDGCCNHGGQPQHQHTHDCGCHSNHEHEQGKCCQQDNKEAHTHHDTECGCHTEKESGEDDDGDHQRSSTTTSLSKAKYKFRVNNLDCANCAMKIENAISQLSYVEDVSLNFSSMILMVNTKRNDTEVLMSDLQQLADSVEKGVTISSYAQSEVARVSHRFEIAQIIIGLALLIGVSVLFKNDPNFQFWAFLVTYLIVGYKVIGTALRNIFKGEVFDENFLMSIATIGAFVLGDYAEAIAVMLFYDVGELFQSIAVNRSRKSIKNLMDIHSDYAIVLRDGEEIQVTPEELAVKDIVVVKVGERIPVDGVVLSGSTSLDISALTGESLPKDVSVHDELLAGSLNMSAVITMEVRKIVSESTVSRVLELVENASSKKAKVEKFITKFSKVYTPMVVLAALIIVVVPTLIYGPEVFSTWLYRGCTFLVISCPCALVVSIPLGLFAGIGGASKKGVLIKGGNYLEALSEIDTIIFDKTGTITKGSFHVEKVLGAPHTLMLAAHGESLSNHPIAKSIVEAYPSTIDTSKLSDYQEIAGQGICVTYDGQELLVGNAKLLNHKQIPFVECDLLGSILYVAYDQQYVGCIVINDEIKETSKKAMESLSQLGVNRKVMLSGDKQEIAASVAKQVGISEVRAQLLPQDKVSVLEEYLNENSKVAFVGDGINDAPVLMRADIGIAMGGIGSDAAIEASDVVLMNDDLSSIATAIKIARKTKKILYQNIAFSLIIKFGVLALTVFGLANMWMGVFADVGVTLIAIINAMRAMYTKE